MQPGYRAWLQSQADAGNIDAHTALKFQGDDGGYWLDPAFGGTGTKAADGSFKDYNREQLEGVLQGFAGQYRNMQHAGFAPATYNASAGGGGGGGSSSLTYDPAAAAYYEDQIRQAERSLGRIGAQRDIGYGNIDSSYNSALNKLLGQNAAAERDYGLNRQRTTDDNVTARSRVDQDVAHKSASLRRLLGDNNSAGLFAAPLAVAQQGSQQLGDIQTAYSRNLQNLDIANDDRKRQFNDSRTDLDTQRTINRNNLDSSLKQNEAQILDQIGGLQVQKAQARGQNYLQARGTAQGYSDRVNSILSQIDQLGRNPAIAAKDVAFTAPDLSQYNTSDIGISGGNAAQQSAGPYFGLLAGDERKRRTV